MIRCWGGKEAWLLSKFRSSCRAAWAMDVFPIGNSSIHSEKRCELHVAESIYPENKLTNRHNRKWMVVLVRWGSSDCTSRKRRTLHTRTKPIVSKKDRWIILRSVISRTPILLLPATNWNGFPYLNVVELMSLSSCWSLKSLLPIPNHSFSGPDEFELFETTAMLSTLVKSEARDEEHAALGRTVTNLALAVLWYRWKIKGRANYKKERVRTIGTSCHAKQWWP